MSDLWRGYCIAVCFQLLIEDLIGKEKYLKAIDVLWVNEPWWLWAIAIAFFFSVPYLTGYLHKRDEAFEAMTKKLHDELDKEISKRSHGIT